MIEGGLFIEKGKIIPKKPSYLIMGLSIVGVFLILTLLYTNKIISKEIIYPNINVAGIPIGGYNKNLAKEKLTNELENKKKNQYLKLLWEEKTWKYSYGDFKVAYNIDKAIEEAYSFGKEGYFLKRLFQYLQLLNNTKEISLEISIDSHITEEIIGEIAKDINQDPKNATINFQNNNISITDHKTGIRLLEYKTKADIKKAILFQNNNIELPIEVIQPKITKDMLKNIKEKLVEFKTKFNPLKYERSYNLKFAASKINGTIFFPGEEFSILEKIGPINKESGYLDAPVIQDGELEPGVGGGVCQIATNVYNAAVRADFKIVERNHHSFPVDYVPIGQDAVIADTWSDMKFINNSESPVYIRMYTEKDILITSVYGMKKQPNQEIKMETMIRSKIEAETIYREDEKEDINFRQEIKKPRAGYKVDVYKVIYEDGEVLNRELLHKDYYKPVNGLVILGTRKLD